LKPLNESFTNGIDMKVLLVGGGGFIGSFVARILLAENVQMVILDNFSSEFQQSARHKPTAT
jgi:UDP-glucose 4-epimerase